MSLDLSDRFDAFRQAARGLWNAHFDHDPPPEPTRELRDSYSDAYVTLFSVIVTYPLPPDTAAIPHLWDGERDVLEDYRVIPREPRAFVMVSPEIPAAGAWNHPVTEVDSATTDFRLISIFDWDTLAPRDFQYFRVRIRAAADADLIGRDALLEANNCRVEYAR